MPAYLVVAFGVSLTTPFVYQVMPNYLRSIGMDRAWVVDGDVARPVARDRGAGGPALAPPAGRLPGDAGPGDRGLRRPVREPGDGPAALAGDGGHPAARDRGGLLLDRRPGVRRRPGLGRPAGQRPVDQHGGDRRPRLAPGEPAGRRGRRALPRPIRPGLPRPLRDQRWRCWSSCSCRFRPPGGPAPAEPARTARPTRSARPASGRSGRGRSAGGPGRA